MCGLNRRGPLLGFRGLGVFRASKRGLGFRVQVIIIMGVYYIPLGHGNYHVGTTGKISGVLFGDHLEIIKRHSFRDIAMSCAKEIRVT